MEEGLKEKMMSNTQSSSPAVSLTIAGSDSGGGAGIQADLKTFLAFGVFGTSAVTAVTAQNTLGVQSSEAVSLELIRAQITSVLSDFQVRSVKTGMLGTPEVIALIAELCRGGMLPRLIVDPVMLASSGDSLADDGAADAYRTLLLPEAFLITPNVQETHALCGVKVTNSKTQLEAAMALCSLGARNVLVKGGDLAGDQEATDLFFDGSRAIRFTARRIATQNTHGTGCTLSAAIAANLAVGHSLQDSIRFSKAYVSDAIRLASSWAIGRGRGPVNHSAPIEA